MVYPSREGNTGSRDIYLQKCSERNIPSLSQLLQLLALKFWHFCMVLNKSQLNALLHSVIGSENSRHSLNQSDAKIKPISTWSPAFSRALGSLVFALSSHWLLKVFSSLPIGCYDYIGLDLRHSIEKRFVSFRWFFMDRSNRFFTLNFFSAIFVLYYLFFVSLVSVLLLLQLNLTNLHHSFQFVVSLKPFFQRDWRF